LSDAKGGRLGLVTAGDAGELQDATSGQSIEPADALVLGYVAEEPEYMTKSQLEALSEPDFYGQAERDQAQLGLVLQAQEEERDVPTEAAFKAMTALRDLPVYERLSRSFEADYDATGEALAGRF